MLMQAPRRPRELFDYFRLFERESGLAGLIGKWDLTEVTPHQIYYSALGRLPEPAQTKTEDGYGAAEQYLRALNSAEFQNGIVTALLQAYPEKARMVFIHIPKCAGSHMSSKLSEKFPAVNFRLMDKNWINSEELFDNLRLLASRLENADQICSYGHLPLNWYLAQGLIRFGDLPFAIVRDPAQVVLSQVNYILTRFVEDRELKSVDTRDWLRFIDRSKLSSSIASNDFRDLAIEILFEKELVPQDLICNFLGAGTAQSAFEMCASASVELTDIAHYGAWLKTRLGIEEGRPSNVSNRYVSLEDLGDDGSKRIAELTEQDNILTETVARLIGQSNRCSISGVELQ